MIKTSDIKVVVAMHKPYWIPADELYLPVQAGAGGKEKIIGMTTDDTGENISLRNDGYHELTALYWAWKNLKADYLGLAHYRRYFTMKRLGAKKEDVLTAGQAAELLEKWDILLPMQRHYVIETNYSQYAHAHHAKDLDTVRQILAEKYPERLEAYDTVMERTNGHRFNMFLMKRELADRYCEWLFDLLFTLEQRLDISAYKESDKRVFGLVSERLLDVWLESERLPYHDIPYLCLENQHWLIKGTAFVYRKLRGGRRRD